MVKIARTRLPPFESLVLVYSFPDCPGFSNFHLAEIYALKLFTLPTHPWPPRSTICRCFEFHRHLLQNGDSLSLQASFSVFMQVYLYSISLCLEIVEILTRIGK